MRVTVRVYPTAKRPSVGGRYGTSEPPILVVRVAAPAAAGKANEELAESLAVAFGVPKRNVRIVSGARNRMKVVEVEGADPQVLTALITAG